METLINSGTERGVVLPTAAAAAAVARTSIAALSSSSSVMRDQANSCAHGFTRERRRSINLKLSLFTRPAGATSEGDGVSTLDINESAPCAPYRARARHIAAREHSCGAQMTGAGREVLGKRSRSILQLISRGKPQCHTREEAGVSTPAIEPHRARARHIADSCSAVLYL